MIQDYGCFEDSKSKFNPWAVADVSVFLKYCCPECEFVSQDLQSFSDHAIANHKDALALFPHEHIVEDWKDGIKLEVQKQCESCLLTECICTAHENLDKPDSFGLGNLENTVEYFPVENDIDGQEQDNSSEIPRERVEYDFRQSVCITEVSISPNHCANMKQETIEMKKGTRSQV